MAGGGEVNDKPIEYNTVWCKSRLQVDEVKKDNRSIYIFSNPFNDDVIAIEGEDLLPCIEELLRVMKVEASQ